MNKIIKKVICALIFISIQFFLVDTFSTVALASNDVLLTTHAGSADIGYKEGKTSEASFAFPYGIAVDKDDGLIVVDSYNNRIRKIKDGTVTTLAGTTAKKDAMGYPIGGWADGDAAKAMFNKPRYAVVDSKGNIFISDTGNNVIRKITGGKVYTFAGTGKAGYTDGPAKNTQFNLPSGLAVDSSDNIYVADTLNHVIRKITPAGQVSTYAGKHGEKGGYADGTALNALFNEPSDIAFDKNGALYISDCGNQLIRKVDKGQVSTFAGVYGEKTQGTNYVKGSFANGMADSSKFNFSKGLAVAEDGTVFVADTWNHRVRAIKPDGSVITVVGTGTAGRKDGVLSEAMLNGPVDLVYNSGILYISDLWNNCIFTLPVTLGSLPNALDNEKLLEGLELDKTTDDIQVFIDGQKIEYADQKPFVENGKVYVPVGAVFTACGYDAKWIELTEKIRIKKGKMYKFFTPNNDTIRLVNGRAVFETEYLAKNLQYTIKWFPEYSAVIIVTQK